MIKMERMLCSVVLADWLTDVPTKVNAIMY